MGFRGQTCFEKTSAWKNGRFSFTTVAATNTHGTVCNCSLVQTCTIINFILFLSISWMDEYGIWFGYCGFLRLGTPKTTECHFSWARNSMVSGSPTSCGSVEVLRKRSGGGEDARFTSSCGSDFLPIHPQNWVVSASICWDKTQTDKARTVTIMFWAWSVWR